MYSIKINLCQLLYFYLLYLYPPSDCCHSTHPPLSRIGMTVMMCDQGSTNEFNVLVIGHITDPASHHHCHCPGFSLARYPHIFAVIDH